MTPVGPGPSAGSAGAGPRADRVGAKRSYGGAGRSPNWAFGDLAGAQCSQALVLLHSGDVDGAARVIRPVPDLEPMYRNAPAGGVPRRTPAISLHRVWGPRSPLDTASARTMTAAGMTGEGTIRGHIQKAGRWRDSVVHAILSEEWKPRPA